MPVWTATLSFWHSGNQAQSKQLNFRFTERSSAITNLMKRSTKITNDKDYKVYKWKTKQHKRRDVLSLPFTSLTILTSLVVITKLFLITRWLLSLITKKHSPFSGFYIGEERYIAENCMRTTNKWQFVKISPDLPVLPTDVFATRIHASDFYTSVWFQTHHGITPMTELHLLRGLAGPLYDTEWSQ